MWKRPGTYVVIVAVIAAVVTAVLPRLPRAVEILRLDEASGLANVLFAVVGVHVAILIALLSVRFLEQRHELRDAIGRIEAAVQGPAVRRLQDQDFYTEFLQAARKATTSVCICYFGPRPPTTVPDPLRRDYYRKMRALMRKRGDQVRFRRLLRRSPDNEQWAADEIRHLIGRSRVDFALLDDLDPAPAANVMPLSLSVQLVDKDKAWLVAVQSHDQIGEFRDLVIEGGDVPPMLQLYFDRLWHHATVMLENGNLTVDGQALLQQFGINV